MTRPTPLYHALVQDLTPARDPGSRLARFERRVSEYVFAGEGASRHLISPKKGWRRILDRAEISDLRIHDLRRTMGSWQASTGASLAVIGKSLGHKDVSTTAIYARLNLDPVRQAMESATNAMLAAGKVTPTADVVPLARRGPLSR